MQYDFGTLTDLLHAVDNDAVTLPEVLFDHDAVFDEASRADIGPDDRLFNLSKGQVTRVLKTAAKKLGLPEIRVHDLRHSALTAMLGANIPPHVVSTIAGHANMTILNRYTHVLPEDERHVADVMNRLATDEEKKEA